jgi:hypothetical protein
MIGQVHAPAVSFRAEERSSGTHFTGCWMRGYVLDMAAKRKFPKLLPWFESPTFYLVISDTNVQDVKSQAKPNLYSAFIRSYLICTICECEFDKPNKSRTIDYSPPASQKVTNDCNYTGTSTPLYVHTSP